MAGTPEDTANGSTEVDDIQGTPAVDATSNDEGTQTDDNPLNKWLNTSLVELKDEHGYTREIMVQEYLNITTTAPDNLASWLQEGSLDVAFALLTAHKEPKNVCALAIQQGVELYNFITGDSTMDDFLRHSTVAPVVKDAKRFIVVPVNDGPLQLKPQEEQGKEDHRIAKEAEEARKEPAEQVEEGEVIEAEEGAAQAEDPAEEYPDLERAYDTPMPDATPEGNENTPEPAPRKKKKLAKRDGKKPNELPEVLPAIGNHWGLLVVDKQTKTARWIDGNITLVIRDGKNDRFPPDMSRAATVAGKILCGIEQLLGPERGKYNAKTAKYVPHQSENNSFRHDHGACGPYVVAFLEYLYQRNRLSHLRTLFGKRKKEQHCNDLDFDSLYTRVEMQRIIQVQSEKDAKADELSLKMTPDVFRILDPKVVAPWVATAWRDRTGMSDRPPGLFDRYEFQKHSARGKRSGGGSGSGGVDGGGGGRGSRPGGGNGGRRPTPPPEKNVWDTDDEDEDDTYIDDLNDPQNTQASKNILRGFIRERPGHYRGCTTKEEAYRLAWRTMKDEDKKAAAEAAATLAAAGNPRAGGDPPPGDDPPPTTNNPPHRSYLPLLNRPDTITDIPADFADEQAVPSEQIKLWRESNLERIERCQLGNKATEDGISMRAILQALSGASFSDESNDRLTSTWLKDPDVFTDDERKTLRDYPGIIGERMKERYEVFDERQPAAAKRSRSGEDNMGGHKKAKMAEDDIMDLSDSVHSDDLNFDSDEEPEQNSPAAASGKSTTPGATQTKRPPPDFLKMPDSDIILWARKLPSDVKDSLLDDIGEKLMWPNRARFYLERIYKKTFQTWAAEDPMTAQSLRGVNQWRRLGTFVGVYTNKTPAGLRKFLVDVLLANERKEGDGKGKTVVKIDLPDYSDNQDKWPKEWK
ncbi:hypothetical protein J4E86_008337 [Alternaria arbusti]|uniref:uncharacterized protein n=1 Tax=Alternaria arbusti TaxID=232088 RepID=UPI0022204D6A|nr:uncharacterized protein J4E86_008337 [Alternaria arbusti]KAI4947821.1 hypothetical protein J4E86_008337 [Alternaria arbusti]